MNSRPSFSEAFRFWLKLGFINFGGPTGQIALMHEELVERKKWIREDQFLHALNYCMLLPGPEAQQLATYMGWLLHRTWGGIVAGAFFVIPSMFLLWILSSVSVVHGSIPRVAALFSGLQPAVLAIIAAATMRIGQKVLKNRVMWVIAIGAFVGICIMKLPFPVIIAGAGLAGWLGGRYFKNEFLVIKGHGGDAQEIIPSTPIKGGLARAGRILLLGLVLWFLPVALAGFWQGWDGVLVKEGLFFSKAAVMTFGGAYAVLPYVAQEAVEYHHWLNAHQMMDGLALAETTPGPLIMVLQFVGFLGAWNHPGNLPPMVAATLGACITTWTTFIPCFLWIFLGAPYIERLRNVAVFNHILSAITAAVVGVILNLAIWFGKAALFPSSWEKPDFFVLILTGIAFWGMYRWKWNMMAVIAGCGVLGVVFRIF